MHLPHITFKKAQDSASGTGVIERNPTTRPATTGYAPGLVNPRTGLGSGHDKGATVGFQPVFMDRFQVETLYQMSWAANKFVNLPIDDMFVMGRNFEGDDEAQADAMMEAERDLEVNDTLANAMKAGRKFGSALLIIVVEGQDLADELKVETIPEGGVVNLWVVDQWNVNVDSYVTDINVRGYGRPYQYKVYQRLDGGSGSGMQVHDPKQGPQHIVHHSRVIRFNGITPTTTEGWWSSPIGREWGISELTLALDTIHRHANMNASIGHLMNEASVFLMKIQGYRDAIKGRVTRGEPTLQELGETTSILKSIYRIFYLDANDEAQRLDYNFAGLADLLDRQNQLLAAIAEVPATRWMGQSPVGMNATGESDAINWAITVKAKQEKLLARPYYMLDQVIARHAGIKKDPPEYEFVPLTTVSDKDLAEAAKANAETILAAFEKQLIDEDEARERLSKIPLFDELGPWTSSLDAARKKRMELENPPQPAPNPKPGGGPTNANG